MKTLLILAVVLGSVFTYSPMAYAEPELAEPVIVINDAQEVVSKNQAPVNTIDIYPEQILQRERDVDLLARLIETEAGSDFIPLEEKAKVGLTVLHRCDNPAFPGSVEENIYKPGQYAKPSETASEDSRLAAEYAMYLWQSGTSYQLLPSEALYFHGDGRKNYFTDVNGNVY